MALREVHGSRAADAQLTRFPEMDTYFIRHTADMDIDDATRDYLWRERKIAIHFPWTAKGDVSKDSSSLNPDDYERSAKRAIRALRRLAETGGYVCAQHYPRAECMVGFVKPDSKIELVRGKWGDRTNDAGRTAVLKTLQLTKVRLVEPLDYAVLLVARPRQGTIMRWPARWQGRREHRRGSHNQTHIGRSLLPAAGDSLQRVPPT